MDEPDLSSLFSTMRPRNVCICKAVSEKTLVEAIQGGCDTMDKLIFKTEASTKCGSCYRQVSHIFEREMKKIEEKSTVEPSI
jgi:NAD(P)H-nitrite reductase large subunit